MTDPEEIHIELEDDVFALRFKTIRQRFATYVLESHPFALEPAVEAIDVAQEKATDQLLMEGLVDRVSMIEALRLPFRQALTSRIEPDQVKYLDETTPGVGPGTRLGQEISRLIDDCDGFLRRESLTASLSPDERRELLAGMVLTRAVDNRLKQLFLGGEVRWGNKSFQGKGFRSLGQEAIYGACLRLRRGDDYRLDGVWSGDIIAPLIRDVGAALAMHPAPEMVRNILSAQMAKAGPPMDGRDFHIGDLSRGVLPPASPLSISSLNVAGIALALSREPAASDGDGRVAVAFIGEGGSSLGEWHEAINACAARALPAVFCVQNNQTALSTPLRDQTATRVFADKALGYGIPGVTIDGTDPEAVTSAFAWAAERARRGLGPVLIELVCMRMCGHAHHDDMLYVGKEPPAGWDYPELQEGGYADAVAWEYWSDRDPLKLYADRLKNEGVISSTDFDDWKQESEQLVEQEAKSVIGADWPDTATVGRRVYVHGPEESRREPLDPRHLLEPGLPEIEESLPFDANGTTFLEAVMLGVGDALESDARVFLYGEDVGGDYGNAFLLLRPLLEKYRDRILNSTLSEGATLGVATGAALAGLRPIAEIQFNDFVASGFNQLVNNAAKIHYRWGGEVPIVVRMPWGGLRSAGPYHSQNTEAWFYRTPGLKIVAPSTPQDARALLATGIADPDPVLYYEHIALYREPKIKQRLPEDPPGPLPLGRAALRRAGEDLAIISYGAYVHRALEVAGRLAQDGIEAAVLDLRSLMPLDKEAVLRVAATCARVLIVHEDTRRGSIGESLAAMIQEEAFEYLDAPIRVVAALDTPVPYSPPLEAAFLPSLEDIERAARALLDY
ncbi:MAG: thiamine pyrophosphate-dependent enzyme [Thermoanaerobaculia bacterium]|nr:thiamine pyrophosphate-dependent enzyme [Thermoanaerobaculia bacterium]